MPQIASGHSNPIALLHLEIIFVARFKIGHTPRKNRHLSAATSRFIAYLLQSRSIIIPYTPLNIKFFIIEHLRIYVHFFVQYIHSDVLQQFFNCLHRVFSTKSKTNSILSILYVIIHYIYCICKFLILIMPNFIMQV